MSETTSPTRTNELLGKLLLSKDEVAELLGVSAETVDYLHRVKNLRGVRVGKRNLWRPHDVQEYVEKLAPAE